MCVVRFHSLEVHKAIRDAHYSRLPDLLNDGGESILWESNSSGWTAVHFSASHFLPREWWRWILQRACASDDTSKTLAINSSCQQSPFLHRRNDLGETVFHVFFQSFLFPYAWQSTQVKNCSRLLLQAIQHVCQSPQLLKVLRKELDETQNNLLQHKDEKSVFFWSEDMYSGAPSRSIYVDRCLRFCLNLHLLAQAALISTPTYNENPKNELENFSQVLPFLAKQTGDLPKPAIQLLLHLYPEQARSPHPENGQYLLHIWCTSTVARVVSNQQYPFLKLLLQAYPEAASQTDRTGRYPLQLALVSGNKSWTSLRPLFEAAPCVLQCLDPVTGLYPACSLAIAAPTGMFSVSGNAPSNSRTASSSSLSVSSLVQFRARQTSAGSKGLVSLWYIMPLSSRQEAIQEASLELESEDIESIFLALRACPRAIAYS